MGVLNATVGDLLKERLYFLRGHPLMRLVIGERNWYIGQRRHRRYGDAEFVCRQFEKAFGYRLDVKSPRSFNEKLQWLKLRYRDPIMAQCADKWGVRSYVSQLGLGHLLNEVYDVVDRVDDLDLDALPPSFVLKATHGSGWNVVCRDKQAMRWGLWQLVMRSWLRQNLYVYGREWVYQDIKPRLMVEKLLAPKSGELLDFKFFCLNGNVEFIQVTDNEGAGHKINLYDPEWHLMNVRYAYENSPRKVDRPAALAEMLDIAKTLSKRFPFARIDLYDVDGRIVFGEVTFFPSSGFRPFDPQSFDLELGRILVLPDSNVPDTAA